MSDVNRYELIGGRIVMTPPAGWPHGSTEATIVHRLRAFVERRKLGVVFGSSTGYDLRIVSLRDVGDRLVVTVHERTPSLGDPVRARVTYPFRLIAFPRSDKPVKLKWPGRP